MTDLEMTKLCAEAMGLLKDGPVIEHGFMQVIGPYDPLHDDAQAMALVRELKVWLTPVYTCDAQGVVCEWRAGIMGVLDDTYPSIKANSRDIRRAIVECVAMSDRGTPND